MRLRGLFTEDDAVSPIIGVILMVAITVVLAAAIGTFMLNVGPDKEKTPQAVWGVQTFDTNDDGSVDNVTLTHEGGDEIESDNLAIVFEGVSKDVGNSKTLQSGSTIDVELSGSSVTESQQLRVVWSPSGSASGNVVFSYLLETEHDSVLENAEA